MAEQKYEESELPLMSVGQRLREAREAAGLSIDDISSRTKIAFRHLSAIEDDRFSDLAGRTYAIGFTRSFARAVGMDETVMADAVRHQLSSDADPRSVSQTKQFEPGDPARVPPSTLAWVAGLGGVGVLILLALFWRSFLNPAGSLPDLIEQEQPELAATDEPSAEGGAKHRQGAASAKTRAVVLTALEEGIWVKVTDASGNQLFQKEMALGETYAVPADAEGPVLATARPDVIGITIGGKSVPRLAETPSTLRDVPVSATALRAWQKNAASRGEREAMSPRAAAPRPAVVRRAPAPAPRRPTAPLPVMPIAQTTPSLPEPPADEASAPAGAPQPDATPDVNNAPASSEAAAAPVMTPQSGETSTDSE
ncbi:MAG: DUF4115 domain-containing protein [Sphingomonadaceae bacterium]|nr:DUF4115 domain-containing protein [Sphingomonadaceae bacterium]